MINAGFFPSRRITMTRGDKMVYAGSFEIADMNTGRQVGDRIRFSIASTTKILTAAVVLEGSRGALQLDTPIQSIREVFVDIVRGSASYAGT